MEQLRRERAQADALALASWVAQPREGEARHEITPVLNWMLCRGGSIGVHPLTIENGNTGFVIDVTGRPVSAPTNIGLASVTLDLRVEAYSVVRSESSRQPNFGQMWYAPLVLRGGAEWSLLTALHDLCPIAVNMWLMAANPSDEVVTLNVQVSGFRTSLRACLPVRRADGSDAVQDTYNRVMDIFTKGIDTSTALGQFYQSKVLSQLPISLPEYLERVFLTTRHKKDLAVLSLDEGVNNQLARQSANMPVALLLPTLQGGVVPTQQAVDGSPDQQVIGRRQRRITVKQE